MKRDMPGNTVRKRRNCRKWLGVLVLIMASGCLVAAAWIAWELKNWDPFTTRGYHPSRPASHEVSFIEGNADITLPPSAYDIYVYSTGFREIDAKVRFSMSADELDEFMRSTLCQQPLRQVEPEQPPTSDRTLEWWTLDQAEHVESCSGIKDHSHQTIEIDMTDSRIYVVFVSTSTF